jgi:oxalate decarboxylase/phosphoglucose isomerase-like protein (cupin superfamily)
MSFKAAEIIELPRFLDERGNLSFLEGNNHIPFIIKRSYWIYDVPGGAVRGGHSYFNNQEFIIAISGSFDVIIDNGETKQTFSLNRSYYGLYVPNNMWRQMDNFSTNSLAFVVSSTVYDEADYERDYEKFLKYRNESISI